jgi:hypothetical protein
MSGAPGTTVPPSKSVRSPATSLPRLGVGEVVEKAEAELPRHRRVVDVADSDRTGVRGRRRKNVRGSVDGQDRHIDIVDKEFQPVAASIQSQSDVPKAAVVVVDDVAAEVSRGPVACVDVEGRPRILEDAERSDDLVVEHHDLIPMRAVFDVEPHADVGDGRDVEQPAHPGFD